MLEFLFPTLWLLLVSFSLGFAVTREKNIMTFGFGLAAFVILSIIINFVGLTLNWLFFLVLAVAIMGYFIYKKEFELTLPKVDLITVLVLVLFLINTYIYWVGSTTYPWLEDDDPWGYAQDAKWVAVTGTHSVPYDGGILNRGPRLEPFPPGYPLLIGVLNQMTDSVSATLKFYNSLLIGAGLIFAFYAFTQLLSDRKMALLATFFLLALPSYMNHFLWAQSLAVPLMLVAFYAFDKSIKDKDNGKDKANKGKDQCNDPGKDKSMGKNFILPAAIASAAIFLTHPAVAAIFALLSLIYFAVQFYLNKAAAVQTLLPILLKIVGIAIFLVCIFYIPVILKYGLNNTLSGIGVFGTFISANGTINQDDTSGGIIYSITDFIFAQPYGKIDQQAGLGLVLSLLALLGVVLAVRAVIKGERSAWVLYGLAWFVITLAGVEGNALPVRLFPHRFWVYLSIPVAIFAAYAYKKLEERFADVRYLLLIVMVLGVVFTSADPKLRVETSVWRAGTDLPYDQELAGYVWIKSHLPVNTRVFPLCAPDARLIGFDMVTDMYDLGYRHFRDSALSMDPSGVHSYLVQKNYSYLVLDLSCVSKLGQENATRLLQAYIQSPEYNGTYSNGAAFLFRVK